MFICNNPTYCHTAEEFDTVAAFLAMCAACFGERPTLTRRIGRSGVVEYIDASGDVVLREI